MQDHSVGLQLMCNRTEPKRTKPLKSEYEYDRLFTDNSTDFYGIMK